MLYARYIHSFIHSYERHCLTPGTFIHISSIALHQVHSFIHSFTQALLLYTGYSHSHKLYCFTPGTFIHVRFIALHQVYSFIHISFIALQQVYSIVPRKLCTICVLFISDTERRYYGNSPLACRRSNRPPIIGRLQSCLMSRAHTPALRPT